MLDEKLIDAIAEEIVRRIRKAEEGCQDGICHDMASPACKAVTTLADPMDPAALARMKKTTTARIGVGKSGPRLRTQTMLTLRADHAKARDSVFTDVEDALLTQLGLFTVQTKCTDKDMYITRPDLGRVLSDEAVSVLRSRCELGPDVQIFAADGLSTSAITANLPNLLPVLQDALKDQGVSVGTPFYLKYGRVGAEDHVAEVLGAKVVCILVGERPGLATAESMSAYLVYNAHQGIEESRRTVISNIHKDGISAVEAGAYIADVIASILEQKTSGVQLKKG